MSQNNKKQGSAKGKTAAAVKKQATQKQAVSKTAVKKAKPAMGKDSPQYLIIVLGLLCAICAMLLAGVNGLTADKIKEISNEKTKAAVQRVAPMAQDTQAIEISEPDGSIVKEAYYIIEGGNKTGYCVVVEPYGYGGALRMMVGVTNDGSVLGVEIIKHSETPGIGSKAQDPTWLDTFKLQSSPIKIVKSSNGAGEIAAISGATITSRAVGAGVQGALDFVGRMK